MLDARQALTGQTQISSATSRRTIGLDRPNDDSPTHESDATVLAN